jgi:hypothetical protein
VKTTPANTLYISKFFGFKREKERFLKATRLNTEEYDRILTANRQKLNKKKREKYKWSRLGISNFLSKGSLKW